MQIAEFEALCGAAYTLDAEIKELEQMKLKPMRAQLEELEQKILQTLNDNNLTSFKSSHGTVVKSLRYSVQTPKSHDQKKEFFKWLNGKYGADVYWDYVTVNSAKLNAFYKGEMENAKEAGDFDFKIPGLSEPEAQPILSLRKK